MSNEIILRTENTISNKSLKTVTGKAVTLLNGGIKAEKDVAKLVYDVNEKELATKAGFKNTADWASRYLGFDKSKTSRYIRIVKEFSDYIREDGLHLWDAFSATQLVEMLKAERVEDIEKISPLMTCKEIREMLKREYIDVNDEQPEDAEPEQPEDAEPEHTQNNATYIQAKQTADIAEMLSTVKHYAQQGNSVLVRTSNGSFTVLIETIII